MSLVISDKKDRETIREYVYRTLCDNILNMNLVPGTALSEQEIASMLSISRTPVREAFIRLSQDALLEILPQRGTYVAPIVLSEVAESRFLRETLELSVMKLACTDFPKPFLDRLHDCLDIQQSIVQKENYKKFFELDWIMHGIIFEGCDKNRIWKIIKQASMNYNRVRVLNLTDGYYELPLLFQQHQQIVEAIEKNNVELGEFVISKHIGKVSDDIEELKKLHCGYFK